MKQNNFSIQYTILTILLLFFVNSTKSQDVLHTNYLNTPLQVNPSLVAFDNDLKIGLSYRGRVSRISQNYNTPILSVAAPLINQEEAKRWGGVGFSVLSDFSGGSNMIKTTGANFAFAYNVLINEKNSISASLGAGYYRRETSLYGMQTGSQYVPNQGYDPNLPLNESFNNETTGFLDLSAGAVWCLAGNDDNNNAFVGISAFHLNQPDVSFDDDKDILPYRFGFQAGYEVFSNEKVSIFPDAGVDLQSEIIRYNAGVKVSIPFKNTENSYLQNTTLSFIPRYVSDNMASLGIEIRKPNASFFFTYDFAVSNRQVNSNVVDAYEVYVGYRRPLMKSKKQKEKIIFDDDYIVGNDRVFDENKEKEIVVVKDTVYIGKETESIEKKWAQKFNDPKTKITFGYKSTEIDSGAMEVLDEIIVYLEENPDYVLEIEGHTDNIGESQNNKQRSLRRAEAIRNYFVEKGTIKSRIRVSGRGETKPIATNATKEGRARNRRVEFKLYRVVK